MRIIIAIKLDLFHEIEMVKSGLQIRTSGFLNNYSLLGTISFNNCVNEDDKSRVSTHPNLAVSLHR